MYFLHNYLEFIQKSRELKQENVFRHMRFTQMDQNRVASAVVRDNYIFWVLLPNSSNSTAEAKAL
jgi:hypothetical protein